MGIVRFDADNHIANRFDILFPNEYKEYLISEGTDSYVFQVHYEKNYAVINVRAKDVPYDVFDKLIKKIFMERSDIIYIPILWGGVNYFPFLYKNPEFKLILPKTIEDFNMQYSGKSRSTLRRKCRKIEKLFGSVSIEVYQNRIPDRLLDNFFRWKYATHNTNYGMRPNEYVRSYHITDATELIAGERSIAVVLLCRVEDVAYLENLSYDTDVAQFSPGLILYEKTIEILIERKISIFFLGGRRYEYKTRFGAQESDTYSGIIYREECFERVNSFFRNNHIKTVSFYGCGRVAHAFLQLMDKFECDVAYGIDRNSSIESINGIRCVSSTDDFEPTDAVIITLKNKEDGLEDFLHLYFRNVFFWHDLMIDTWEMNNA